MLFLRAFISYILSMYLEGNKKTQSAISHNKYLKLFN